MPWRSHGWRWPVWQESRLSRARPWRTTWTRFLPGIPHSRRRTSCWQRCWQACVGAPVPGAGAGAAARARARSRRTGGARARGGDRRARTAPGEPFRHREQRVRSQHARAFLSCCHRRVSHRRRDRTRNSRPVDEARPIPPHDTRTESHRQPARARSRLRHPHRVLPPAHDRRVLIEQFSRVATQRPFADFPDFGKNFEVRRC